MPFVERALAGRWISAYPSHKRPRCRGAPIGILPTMRRHVDTPLNIHAKCAQIMVQTLGVVENDCLRVRLRSAEQLSKYGVGFSFLDQAAPAQALPLSTW